MCFSRIVLLLFLSFVAVGCGGPLSDENQREAASLVRANLLCSLLVRHSVSTLEMDARTEDEHFELGYLIYDRSFLDVSQLTFQNGDYKDFDDFMVDFDASVKTDLSAVLEMYGNTSKVRSNFGRQFYEWMKKSDQEKSGYGYENCGAAYVIGKRFYDERFN